MFRTTTSLLRGALLADAVASGVLGVLMAVLAEPLAGLLGLPRDLLRWSGVGLVPFALFLGWLGLRPEQPAGAVQAVVLVNLAWVVGSILMLALAPATTPLGSVFVGLQALAVLALAVAQWIGGGRADSASAA